MLDHIPESAEEEVKEVKEVKEEVNVILVTHSARIRCFMDTFFKNTQTEQPHEDSNNPPREKIRLCYGRDCELKISKAVLNRQLSLLILTCCVYNILRRPTTHCCLCSVTKISKYDS